MTAEEQAKYEYYRSQADYVQDEAFALGFVATAYIEDSLDAKFWSHLFEGKKIGFQYFTRTERGNRARGSGQCLLYKNYSLLNREFFICIDSDYRFLLQEKGISIQHFVFQTYTYSIENHFCYAKKVQAICQDFGFQDFDFEAFLQAYSKIIFPLLVYSVYREKNGITGDDFSRHHFADKITHFESNDINDILIEISQIVENELRIIFQNIGLSEQKSLKKMKNQLKALGVNETNAYLFIRGHDLQDKLILPILNKMKHLKLSQLNPKDREEVHSKNIRNLLENPEKIGYFEYFQLSNIQQDINTFFTKP